MHSAIDIDELCVTGFRRAAATLGVSPHIVGARLDMAAEKKRRDNDPRLPDELYFRGYLPSKGEFAFALTTEKDTGLHRGAPDVRFVAWRYIHRVLNDQSNSHLLEKNHVLEDLTHAEFIDRLSKAAREPDVPDHVREILAEAARRTEALSADHEPRAAHVR